MHRITAHAPALRLPAIALSTLFFLHVAFKGHDSCTLISCVLSKCPKT
jgi:hypothetical protein